jgi:hypothetical protein
VFETSFHPEEIKISEETEETDCSAELMAYSQALGDWSKPKESM